MCTITMQRVDDVDREQLLAPQAVETMACRLAEGRLVHECDRRAAWDVYARGSPGAGGQRLSVWGVPCIRTL